MNFNSRFARYALALAATVAALILRIAIVHFAGPDQNYG